ncbi:hypothetical protein ERO13_A02G148200v2 [Gossypium hirsutum]|uniref:Uncharacterized protein n=4 Tax=Gossypium TaxID=3633 RepID=A0A5J5WNT4_GOSBA|nr:hypothetical protein ES319_A02G161800v1 [Gossypium barbadense]KAG4212175.1 hypothetical protein ERO13_A02G148200v2 [Gossypium hirsutum]TYH28870.1 hypothetical protein ES288_A02G178100v1 [Gossypium darwinii]TYI40686.1 hypothetical protein ES332_A02G180300v1 [Gossypium tomentosum]TYJ47127.1 hypothetical protein E1A91_A02G166400v1 [Gossypium mustelinum]
MPFQQIHLPKNLFTLPANLSSHFLLHHQIQSGFLLHLPSRVISLWFSASSFRPIDNTNLMASNPARAFATNEDEILLWRIIFEASNSPIWSRTTKPEADLNHLLSKAASNCTVVLVVILGG